MLTKLWFELAILGGKGGRRATEARISQPDGAGLPSVGMKNRKREAKYDLDIKE